MADPPRMPPPQHVLDAIPEVKTPLGQHRLRLITGLVTIAAAYVCVTAEYNGPLSKKEHVFSGVRADASVARTRAHALLAAVEGVARGLGGSWREAGGAESAGGVATTVMSRGSDTLSARGGVCLSAQPRLFAGEVRAARARAAALRSAERS